MFTRCCAFRKISRAKGAGPFETPAATAARCAPGGAAWLPALRACKEGGKVSASGMKLADDWIIQRAVRIRTASDGDGDGDGGDEYEPWPGYTHPMTGDEAMKALAECEARWPELEFRAHRLRVEEKIAAAAIDRARLRSKGG
ncbi:hypothetical protein R75465_07670 [Paraburkholderia aspalathi]|nr:hypothetical protein R75465_07670 [Paraburkholderia aspalathi]